MTPWPQWIALAAWAGFCSSDQRALGARQIHQPIVAAVGAGLLLGDPGRALWIGAWMQLVGHTALPLGGVILADRGAAAVVAVIVAAALPGGAGLFAGLLAGIGFAALSIPWERALREGNGRREEKILGQGGDGIAGAMAHGVAGPWIRGAVAAVGAGLLAVAALPLWLRSGAAGWIAERAAAEGLVAGAAGFGAVFLLDGARAETGPRPILWIVAGIAIGAAGRLLLGSGA